MLNQFDCGYLLGSLATGCLALGAWIFYELCQEDEEE